MADDDIERLLREVDALNSGTPTPANVPAKRSEDAPVQKGKPAKESSGRLAFAVGATVVLAPATWFVGLILPFQSAVSMGLGGAVAAFVTAFVAGPPRWFSKP
jgi:hypothetical protein